MRPMGGEFPGPTKRPRRTSIEGVFNRGHFGAVYLQEVGVFLHYSLVLRGQLETCSTDVICLNMTRTASVSI